MALFSLSVEVRPKSAKSLLKSGMASLWYKIEVAPLTVLPFKKAVFTYGFPKKILPGSIVTIPLSGRTLPGVVLSVVKENTEVPTWVKNITAVENRPLLTPSQLELAKVVSTMTFTPLGRVLKHFVPKVAGVRKTLAPPTPTSPFKTNPGAKATTATILKTLEKNEAIFVTLPFHQNSLVTLFTFIQKLLMTYQGQVLILVPDISTAVRLEQSFLPYCKAHTLVSLHHSKTAGQYYRDWQSVQENKARIIIATRTGLFAPFQKLSAIIQIDPADESYKQWDMSPRYDAHFLIPALQKLWEAKYIAIGALPTLSALHTQLPVVEFQKSNITPEWINLKIERYQKNWGALSVPLQAVLQENIRQGKQTLLYVHQGGLESFSVCKECRTIFRCPNCKSALKLTSSDHYQCNHCGFKSSLFPKCPSCQNIHFKSVGFGTEKVAKEVAKAFPGAQVSVADKKHLQNSKSIATFLEKMALKKPDILIATAAYLRFPPLPALFAIAIIDADTLLNLPGYRKDEQFIELIEKAKSLLPPAGRLLVQTFHPESDIFQKITNEGTGALLSALLQERIDLRYPPFTRCLTLDVRPKKNNGTELLVTATAKLKALVAKNPTLKKSTLVTAATKKERGVLKKYTLVRYQPPLSPALATFLTNHADTILIDHDPQRIT